MDIYTINTNKQFKYLIIPIGWYILFRSLFPHINMNYTIYFSFIYFTGLAVYFLLIGSISLKSLFDEWKKGRSFWLPVVFNIVGEIIAFGIEMGLSPLLPNVDNGIKVYNITGWTSLIAFALTTIFLGPIAEEAFFRKGIINFSSRRMLILSSIISVLLFAVEHSYKPLGIFTAALWGIPFTITYIKTKNVYIPMTAHLICNFVANGIPTIIMAAKMLKML